MFYDLCSKLTKPYFMFLYRYMSRPVMSGPGLYDPTTIMNADILAFCQKEGWCKLAFYLLSFFYYLYGYVFICIYMYWYVFVCIYMYLYAFPFYWLSFLVRLLFQITAIENVVSFVLPLPHSRQNDRKIPPWITVCLFFFFFLSRMIYVLVSS